MKMQKNRFRIGTLAEELNLEKFVIRFWEKEFNIRSSRSSGGQRYYTPSDVEKFKQIKNLLYDQKFTIAGAKSALNTSTHIYVDKDKIIGSKKTTIQEQDNFTVSKTKLLALRNALLTLKDYL